MNISKLLSLALPLVLLFLAAPAFGQGICPICGKRNCPYASGSNTAPAVTVPSDREINARLNAATQEAAKNDSELLSYLQRNETPPQKVIQRVQAQARLTLERDPEFDRLRARQLVERTSQLAATEASSPPPPLSPEQFRAQVANVIKQDPQTKDYSPAQRKLFAEGGAYSQLLFAVEKSKTATAGPGDTARQIAGIPFEMNPGVGNGSEKLRTAIKMMTDNSQVAQKKETQSRGIFESIKQAVAKPTERAQLMRANSEQKEMQSALARQTAIATALNKEARDRERGLQIRDVPLPPAAKDEKQAQSSAQKWSDAVIKKIEEDIGHVHKIYLE